MLNVTSDLSKPHLFCVLLFLFFSFFLSSFLPLWFSTFPWAFSAFLIFGFLVLFPILADLAGAGAGVVLLSKLLTELDLYQPVTAKDQNRRGQLITGHLNDLGIKS